MMSYYEIELAVKAHMKEQPYHCKCADCGGDLEYSTDVDDDGDLHLKIYPCDKCNQEATNE